MSKIFDALKKSESEQRIRRGLRGRPKGPKYWLSRILLVIILAVLMALNLYFYNALVTFSQANQQLENEIGQMALQIEENTGNFSSFSADLEEINDKVIDLSSSVDTLANQFTALESTFGTASVEKLAKISLDLRINTAAIENLARQLEELKSRLYSQ